MLYHANTLLHSQLDETDTEDDYAAKTTRLTEINQPLVAITDGAYSNEVWPTTYTTQAFVRTDSFSG